MKIVIRVTAIIRAHRFKNYTREETIMGITRSWSNCVFQNFYFKIVKLLEHIWDDFFLLAKKTPKFTKRLKILSWKSCSALPDSWLSLNIPILDQTLHSTLDLLSWWGRGMGEKVNRPQGGRKRRERFVDNLCWSSVLTRRVAHKWGTLLQEARRQLCSLEFNRAFLFFFLPGADGFCEDPTGYLQSLSLHPAQR